MRGLRLVDLAGRARLVLPVAAAVFAVDQASKLVAAAVHPASYVLNSRGPSGLGTAAVALTIALVLTLPSRAALVAAAVWAGGASGNLVDAYLWPGGVPDFLRVRWVLGTFNLADVFIFTGAVALGLSLAVWLLLGVVRRPSADAGAQVAE
jgi:lipoprotein signal peptidase